MEYWKNISIIDLDGEYWRSINGWPNYVFSNLGRIKSLGREYDWRRSRKSVPDRIRKQTFDSSGYLSITLIPIVGKRITFKAHRLIATAHIKNTRKCPQINHKNGVKTDNRIDNLEWCTRSENIQHAHRTGLKHAKIGSSNGMSKLVESDVYEILKSNLTNSKLAKKYKVDRHNIAAIRRRETWKHVKI